MLPKDSGGYNSIIMLPKDSGGYNTLILTVPCRHSQIEALCFVDLLTNDGLLNLEIPFHYPHSPQFHTLLLLSNSFPPTPHLAVAPLDSHLSCFLIASIFCSSISPIIRYIDFLRSQY